MNWLQNRLFEEPPRYWGAAIAAAGAIGSALLGNAGASSANSRSSMDSWAMYLNNINLSNSSYQRAAKDLEKAGVNPIMLTGGLSGADTPKGSSFNYQNENAIPSQALANLGNAVSQAELNDAKAATEKSVQSANSSYANEASAHARQMSIQNQFDQARLDYMNDLKKNDPSAYRSFMASEFAAGSKSAQNPGAGLFGAGYDWLSKNKDNISRGIKGLIGNSSKAVIEASPRGKYIPKLDFKKYPPYRGHK